MTELARCSVLRSLRREGRLNILFDTGDGDCVDGIAGT